MRIGVKRIDLLRAGGNTLSVGRQPGKSGEKRGPLRDTLAFAFRLLPEIDVVGFGAIATALEKSPAEMALVWNSLPLDDTTIALELATTAPKVKNLRQSAYDTLSWRMRPFRRGTLRRLWLAALCLPPPLATILQFAGVCLPATSPSSLGHGRPARMPAYPEKRNFCNGFRSQETSDL
jgi:hypothetical protein